MDTNAKLPPEQYDPTVRTTVDEVRGTVECPGSLVEATGDGEKVIELDRLLVLIGSDPAADIVIADRGVADYHAEITYEKGFYVLRHLEGRRGVAVNGKSIKEYILEDNDEIQIADHVFVFKAPTPAPGTCE